jgi:hypothetical protein
VVRLPFYVELSNADLDRIIEGILGFGRSA